MEGGIFLTDPIEADKNTTQLENEQSSYSFQSSEQPGEDRPIAPEGVWQAECNVNLVYEHDVPPSANHVDLADLFSDPSFVVNLKITKIVEHYKILMTDFVRSIFSILNDKGMLDFKCQYYQEVYELKVTPDQLKNWHLKRQDLLIRQAENAALKYLEKNIKTMFVAAIDEFIHEAYLASTADIGVGHPILNETNYSKLLYAPVLEDVEKSLLEPHAERIKERLISGKREYPNRPEVNIVDILLPTWRYYDKTMTRIIDAKRKGESLKTIDERLSNDRLHEIATYNNTLGWKHRVCEAVIEALKLKNIASGTLVKRIKLAEKKEKEIAALLADELEKGI